ncbi:MAG TPA: NAD-dependent epimerase/dehydratase family protein [Anaerolineae bacterium]|nr:NAD-dependent epimerase/dehydratase family protein [Anaerolineae bacterium]
MATQSLAANHLNPVESAPQRGVALVTGAAGFIGSHLAERLLNQNYTVLALDSFTDYYARERKERNVLDLYDTANQRGARFTFMEADLRTADLCDLLTRHHVRVIFHQAGQAGVRPSWGKEFQPYVERNILATQALLEACVHLPDPQQIQKFIFASSSSVYGDAEKFPTSEDELPRPISPYGVTKLAAEHLCFLYAKQYGLPVVALRYFSVYGPRQRPDMGFYSFIDALLHDRPIRIFGDGEQTREFTYVGDIVEANLLALNARNGGAHLYNIGGGSRVTLNAAIETLAQVAGVLPRLEYQPRAAGDHRHGAADISRARRELGYQPRVSLEDGLRKQLDWQKNAVGSRQ